MGHKNNRGRHHPKGMSPCWGIATGAQEILARKRKGKDGSLQGHDGRTRRMRTEAQLAGESLLRPELKLIDEMVH